MKQSAGVCIALCLRVQSQSLTSLAPCRHIRRPLPRVPCPPSSSPTLAWNEPLHSVLYVSTLCAVHYALRHRVQPLLHRIGMSIHVPHPLRLAISPSVYQSSTGVHGFANETKLLIGADILISVCDLMGEFILLYRCWIVWERNYWVIIFPALTSLAGFGESYISQRSYSKHSRQ